MIFVTFYRTQLELAQSKLQEKIKYLEDGKNELRELSQKEKAFEKFQFNNKNKKYNEMIKWGYANDCERKYKAIRKQREDKCSEVEMLRNDLNGWLGSLEDLHRNKEILEQKNNEIRDRAQEKEEVIQKMKDDVSILIENKQRLESRFKEITDNQGKLNVRIMQHRNYESRFYRFLLWKRAKYIILNFQGRRENRYKN